jgi:hypothetical protein
MVYLAGRKPQDDLSWVGSSDALSPEIEKFVDAQGAATMPAPKEFSLSSLFVRKALSHIDSLAFKARLANILESISAPTTSNWLHFRRVTGASFSGILKSEKDLPK